MKKLLAIAVAAAVAAPAAFADGHVKVYGKAHASIASVDGSVDGTVFGDKGSRLGVKGMAGLSNGLKATYLWEAGVNFVDSSRVADGGLIGTARHAWVGLKGGFGEVRIGRQYTAIKVVSGKAEMFADQYGDYNSVLNGAEVTADNAIAYINKFGPVGVAIAYAADDDKDQTLTGSNFNADGAVTGMINYSSNGIYAGIGMISTSGNANNDTDAVRAALAYKFPAGHKVGFAYEDVDGAADESILLSGGYKMGKAMLKAQYGERGNAELLALGADYKLSKKTKAYIEHSMGDGGLSLNGEGTGPDVDGEASATAIGLMHSF